MDALEFIKERNRMCRSFGGSCNGCPADKNICCSTFGWQEELVAIVEKWSKENPRKTRQDVFLEMWPESFLDEYGILQFCPRYISAAYRNDDGKCKNPEKKCIDCSHEFWTQEVE